VLNPRVKGALHMLRTDKELGNIQKNSLQYPTERESGVFGLEHRSLKKDITYNLSIENGLIEFERLIALLT